MDAKDGVDDARVAEPAAGPAAADLLAAWILNEGWQIPDPRTLTGRFGEACNRLGVPLFRVRVTIRTLHPQFIGTTYTWTRGSAEVEEFLPTYEMLQEDRFLKSPYAPIYQGAGAIRRRLEGPGTPLDFPILTELKEQGATDYVAMPLVFSDGRINAITLASDRAGGFAGAELKTMDDVLPLLARVYEVHALRRTAQTILETYLGRYSGERVLKGLIRRGDGEEIHAAIWFCDLRGSTAMAERLPRPDFLAALNDFFGAIAGAVLAHGGEVLRFIGDAALAIFPIASRTDCPEQCPEHIAVATAAVAAAEDAIGRLKAVNAERAAQGRPELRFGIGLHLGDVLYGNIGAPERLEFTVIGPAANEAARIESLCKALDRPLLISEALAKVVPARTLSLGSHALRGVRDPHEIFTLRETAQPER